MAIVVMMMEAVVAVGLLGLPLDLGIQMRMIKEEVRMFEIECIKRSRKVVEGEKRLDRTLKEREMGLLDFERSTSSLNSLSCTQG